MERNLTENIQVNITENLTENLKESIKENIQENIKELQERRNYTRYAKVMAGGMCSLICTFLAIYVGGWLMILEPLKDAVTAFSLGTLTRKMVVTTVLKWLFSLTIAGAIWCAGYILEHKIIGHEEC